jgi:CheY-like chemotaxis protein
VESRPCAGSLFFIGCLIDVIEYWSSALRRQSNFKINFNTTPMKSNLTVMYIEHSKLDINLFKLVLKEIDTSIKCMPFDRSAKALDYLSKDGQSLPDYIFLDLNMPDIGGIECLQRIKKVKAIKNIPVIMYSNEVVRMYREDAKRDGAHQCLRKVIDFDRSCKDIASILFQKA